MELVYVASGIIGLILPFIVAFLKRWVVLDSKQMGTLVLILSFIIAAIVELIANGFHFEQLYAKLGTIYTTSQLIYFAVFKGSDIETRLEGNGTK